MLTAKQANVLATGKSFWDDYDSLFKGVEKDSEVISILTYKFLNDIIRHITFCCYQRKTRAFILPFSEVPGKYHPPHIEDKVMENITDYLYDKGFQVEHDRRDGRVVLIVNW